MDVYNTHAHPMNPEAMILNTAGINAVSKALNAANSAAASNKSGPKYKKAPDAPKRFKSAFIIYSAEKHREIKEDLISQGRTEKTTDIAKLVSEAWREMPAEEKENWEKKARKDKARYEVEKAMYKGPWKVQANKRTPKDPSAPKRPMSAFLAFSNKRRAALKREHPDATNADLSKMLSVTWKEIPDDVRKKYMDEEALLRATYKVDVAKWRKKVADEKKLERNEREAIAMQTAEARAKEPQGPMMTASNMMTQPSMMTQSNMNNLVVANARSSQFNNGQVPNQGSMIGNMGGVPGQLHPPPSHQQDMNNGMSGGVYGNPYGMPGPAGGQLGQFGMSGGPEAAQYASLMAGAANPFATQSFMGNTSSSQQQLLSQLFAGQQFKNPMGQAGGLVMYPGLGGQGMQGGYGNQMGGYGGFGAGGMPNGGSGNVDMAATQRAMLEAAQNGGGVAMAPQQQQQVQQMMQHHNGNQYNPNMGQGMNSFQGNMMGGGGGMMPNASGGPPMGNEWMNQQQQQQQQQQQPQPQYNNPRPSSDVVKKEEEEDPQQQQHYR